MHSCHPCKVSTDNPSIDPVQPLGHALVSDFTEYARYDPYLR